MNRNWKKIEIKYWEIWKLNQIIFFDDRWSNGKMKPRCDMQQYKYLRKYSNYVFDYYEETNNLHQNWI
jgi:hypothetical protein